MQLDKVVWTDPAILAEIQCDTLLAYSMGYEIRMQDAGVWAHNGRYVGKTFLGRKCSVCTLGAFLLGEQSKSARYGDDIADYFGRPRVWGEGLFTATDPGWSDRDDPPGYKACSPSYVAGWRIGKTLYRWVEINQKPGGLLEARS